MDGYDVTTQVGERVHSRLLPSAPANMPIDVGDETSMQVLEGNQFALHLRVPVGVAMIAR